MSDTGATVTRVAGGGVAGGIVAWVAGYLVVYVLAATRIENSVGSAVLEFLTEQNVTWQLVGWLFYNAHYVTIRIPGLFNQTVQNFIADASQPSVTLLFAIPPVLLVVAGTAVAWGTTDELGKAARNGAALVLGYLPLSVIGAFLFTVSAGNRSAGPTLVTAALLAGVVYPAVFGAVGGLVGGYLSSE